MENKDTKSRNKGKLMPPCKCCKKVWHISEKDKYYFHKDIGTVCREHHGIKQFFEEYLQKKSEKEVVNNDGIVITKLDQ
jgi:hypothetical protein